MKDIAIIECTPSNQPKIEVRLDKWLWAARFYKTRTLARQAIECGKVYYNGKITRPTRVVEKGATLTLQQGSCLRTIIVHNVSKQRRSPHQANLLYEETLKSQQKYNESLVERRSLSTKTFPKYTDAKHQQAILTHSAATPLKIGDGGTLSNTKPSLPPSEQHHNDLDKSQFLSHPNHYERRRARFLRRGCKNET